MENSVGFRRRKPSEISSAELLRQCGQKLTDRALWEMFQERFQRLIFTYLYRALKYHSKTDDLIEVVNDLGQEVYVRLVQHNASLLRNFRGETDLSVAALLGRVCMSVVSDKLRRDGAARRMNNVVSISAAKELLESSRNERDELNVSAILSWIDVERMVAADPDQKNAQRNALIFKLHYMDGLTTSEIASYPGFDLTESGVEAVLVRLRKRIKK
jgi:RNA polymerase sigma factor (sigma-70 family)